MTSEEYKPDPETTPEVKTRKPRRTKAQMAADREANVEKRQADHAEKNPPAPVEEAKPDKYAIAAARREDSRNKFEKSGFIQGQQLLASQRPGFVRRWVNDEKGKLDRRLDQGYTFVEEGAATAPFEAVSDNVGSRKSQRVGTTDDLQPLNAYLMEIPEDFHKQDQQTKERAILKTAEAAKRGGSIGSQGYIPDGESQFELE